MNTTEENGKLNLLYGKLKKKFASLTNDDKMHQEGEKQEVFGNHQIRIGRTKEDLRRIISLL